MFHLSKNCFRTISSVCSAYPLGVSSKFVLRNGLTSLKQQISLTARREATTLAASATVKAAPRNEKLVGYWLLGCGAMVFGAVVLGGMTRLTESGLSLVTWQLLGEKRPVTQEEWEAEFIKYQQFPEFKIKNKDMTLNEFKSIWWTAYAHRMWGRTIAAAFFIPATFFWARGYLLPSQKWRLVGIGALIGLQGLMGRYMVQSGLDDRFHGENDMPRISQYRLAVHLSAGFFLYTFFLWHALGILLPVQAAASVTNGARWFTWFAHTCKGLVFFTSVSGAFVAGLNAGLVYNSFPKMADRWIPDDILAYSPALSNITENPTTVQFIHRVMGTTTLGLITGMWLLSRKRILPPRAYTAATAVAVMAYLQVGLGITTLLTYVPMPLAASHQSGALVLLSLFVWLTHELRLVKYLPK